MKNRRLIVAIILMVLVVGSATISLLDLRHGLDQLETALEAAKSTAPQQHELLVERCVAIPEIWERAESRFVLYISHNTLEHVAQMVYELPQLAIYADYSELYSHLDAVSALLDGLWQTSVPSYRTLL